MTSINLLKAEVLWLSSHDVMQTKLFNEASYDPPSSNEQNLLLLMMFYVVLTRSWPEPKSAEAFVKNKNVNYNICLWVRQDSSSEPNVCSCWGFDPNFLRFSRADSVFCCFFSTIRRKNKVLIWIWVNDHQFEFHWKVSNLLRSSVLRND